jgi:hypothetical protein
MSCHRVLCQIGDISVFDNWSMTLEKTVMANIGDKAQLPNVEDREDDSNLSTGDQSKMRRQRRTFEDMAESRARELQTDTIEYPEKKLAKVGSQSFSYLFR